jgi:hypothetical protein
MIKNSSSEASKESLIIQKEERYRRNKKEKGENPCSSFSS